MSSLEPLHMNGPDWLPFWRCVNSPMMDQIELTPPPCETAVPGHICWNPAPCLVKTIWLPVIMIPVTLSLYMSPDITCWLSVIFNFPGKPLPTMFQVVLLNMDMDKFLFDI